MGSVGMSGRDVSITEDCIHASVIFCFLTITVSWIILFLIPLFLLFWMIFTVLLNDWWLIVVYFVTLLLHFPPPVCAHHAFLDIFANS